MDEDEQTETDRIVLQSEELLLTTEVGPCGANACCDRDCAARRLEIDASCASLHLRADLIFIAIFSFALFD